MKKILLSLFLIGGFLFSFTALDKAYAAEEDVLQGWVQEDGNWYFYNKGEKLTGKITVNGKKYFMDLNSGAMKTGWIKEDNIYWGVTWYFANPNGELKENTWYLENGKWYYFNEDGAMATGATKIGNKMYFFDVNTGAMYDKGGWIKEEYSSDPDTWDWYYAKPNGELYFNQWIKVGNHWYYFSNYGVMVTGVRLIDSEYYVFNSKGQLSKGGWVEAYGTWWYTNTSGKPYIGWKLINNKWYYFSPVGNYDFSMGQMVTGPYIIDGKTYFFTNNGDLPTYEGWHKHRDDWYYTNKDGTVVKGWKLIGGKWYYFSEYTGYMYTGVYHINSKLYFFNSDGSWYSKPGWVKHGEEWLYVNSDGSLATGWVQIGGTWYYFDEYYGYLHESA